LLVPVALAADRLPLPASPNKDPSFIEAAQSYLDQPLFTVDLGNPSNAVMSLGAVDKSRYSGIRTQDIFLRVPSRLVSIAAFAQANINLRSPTVQAVHPPLRRYTSLTPTKQSCQSQTSFDGVSFSSTLDGDV